MKYKRQEKQNNVVKICLYSSLSTKSICCHLYLRYFICLPLGFSIVVRLGGIHNTQIGILYQCRCTTPNDIFLK